MNQDDDIHGSMEPSAHMYPSDLERFEASETFAHAYSAAVGSPDERSEPLYRFDEVRKAILLAVETERYACSIAVWMTLQDALADDADDKGLEGWMREAEERVKGRLKSDTDQFRAGTCGRMAGRSLKRQP